MNDTIENDAAAVLITGGAKRIGAALVNAFHQQGMKVLFQYHTSAQQAQNLADITQQKASAVSYCGVL